MATSILATFFPLPAFSSLFYFSRNFIVIDLSLFGVQPCNNLNILVTLLKLNESATLVQTFPSCLPLSPTMSVAAQQPDAAAEDSPESPAAPPKEDCGVKGQEYLAPYLDKSKSECLNEADDHPYGHCLTSGGGFLESDCDEQLILSLSFNQAVKVHSIKVKAPRDKGPKSVRIFQNQPNTLDFDSADGSTSTQDLT